MIAAGIVFEYTPAPGGKTLIIIGWAWGRWLGAEGRIPILKIIVVGFDSPIRFEFAAIVLWGATWIIEIFPIA